MRKTLIAAASITLLTALGAHAQEAPAPQSPSQSPATAPNEAPMQRVNVVDVSELSEESQKQVEQIVAEANDENLQQMRSNIDAIPGAKEALEAKGATSAQVVATNVSGDGTLTLITKKNS